MIISIKKFAATYYPLAKQLPAGFKNVFVETKGGIALRRLRYDGKPLSRRQEITLKKNSEALSKLFLFAFAQTVPVVGWLPIIVALTYPRFLLTAHFWSDEQKIAFMAEEYSERCESAAELRRQMTLKSAARASLFLHGGKLSSLDELSAEHIKLLAGANAVHGNIVTRTFTPAFLSRIMLRDVAAFITRDDMLLRLEGVEDLTAEEVQEALLQRGLPYIGPVATDLARDVSDISDDVTADPTGVTAADVTFFSSDLDRRESLRVWLGIYDVVPTERPAEHSVEHSAVTSVPIGESSPVAAVIGHTAVISQSYLLHSIALPEIRSEAASANRQVRF